MELSQKHLVKFEYDEDHNLTNTTELILTERLFLFIAHKEKELHDNMACELLCR